MKISLKIEKEFDVKYLKAICSVRYWEDGTINGESDKDGSQTPCANGDNWEPLIEINSGKILNWEQGKTASLHYKICDCGVYQLLDENKEKIHEIEGYVPKVMCPKENGYGDYLIMDIDENGFIKNFNEDMIEEDFTTEDY